MKKSLYFDEVCGYGISVAAENGKVTEFNFEKPEAECAAGNIYKGKIERILPGMQAIFVNCGLERNCFLSLDDALPDSENYDVGAVERPYKGLKEGDEIPVQVTKLPVGNKGAKVTARLSFIGKCLIYMPQTPFVGVSRKIADEELRRNLVYTVKSFKDADDGLVIRTAAPYVKLDRIKDEFIYLKNTWREVSESFKTAPCGSLLYTDGSLPESVLRDTLSTDIDEIVAGNAALRDKIESIVNRYPAQVRKKVYLHDTGRDMLEELGIMAQLATIASPRAELENGAHIVIERTEALTVIDVNTGKFTGDYNLEQTVYHTNILAAREIARQVRLRNLGGIFVVDFIDMSNEAHKTALVEELERALKRDRAKCTVSPVSQFGLVEFTRKRIGASPANLMTKPCRYCAESGYTMSAEYILINMRAKLLKLISDGVTAVRVDLNGDILERMISWRELTADLKGRGAQLYFVPHRSYHEHQINYRTNGFELPPKQ